MFCDTINFHMYIHSFASGVLCRVVRPSVITISSFYMLFIYLSSSKTLLLLLNHRIDKISWLFAKISNMAVIPYAPYIHLY